MIAQLLAWLAQVFTPKPAPQPAAPPPPPPQPDPDFLFAETFTRKAEGGWYAGDKPGDPNPTNFGIIQKTYDVYRAAKKLPLRSVQLIEDPEVHDIYGDYWDKGDCHLFSQYSRLLACAHFDTTFNSGEISIKLLQRTVGAQEDGVMGPLTIALIKDKLSKDEKGLIVAYLSTRYSYLRGLWNWPQERHFWTIRLNQLSAYLGSTWYQAL